MSKIQKDKLSKKDKIKKIVFIIIHVICYACTFLFLLACLLGGIQSCNNKTKGVSAESINYSSSYYYNFRYVSDSNITMDKDLHDNLIESFGLPVTTSQAPTETPITFTYYLSNTYTEGPYYYNVESINYVFDSYLYTGNLYWWSFRECYFVTDLDSHLTLIERIYDNPETLEYVTYYDLNVISSFDFWSLNGSRYLWFDYQALDSFVFNQNFNYNAPMLVNVNSPYGTGVTGGTPQGTLFTKLIVNTGYFISNNQIFNSIEFWYQLSDGLSFDFNGTIKQGPQGMWSYWCTYYVNSRSGTSVIANSRDIVAYMPTSTSYGYYQANSSTWINDNYRYINFIQPIDNDIKTALIQFNNNNQSYYGGQIYGGTDIFELLSSAFTSLLPFLSINILPSISIGILLFLPAIVGIIVIIFNILRK